MQSSPSRRWRLNQVWSDLAMISLLGVLYAPLLAHWVRGWLGKSIGIEHEYFSHGLIGLPYAAFLIWQQRSVWYRLPGGAGAYGGGDRWIGLGGILFAIGLYSSGLPDAVNLSFPFLLTSLCLWLKGVSGLKLMAFPLLFIWFASPNDIPYLVTPFTQPLQALIAGTAGVILNLLGFNVEIQGIHLFMNDRQVEVAPYCAGLKMLFTSLYVALMLLHWTDNWRSKSIVTWFLSLTALISGIGNIIRNTILTYFHGTHKDAAFIWLHDGWGGDVYSALTLGLLVLLINRLEDWLTPLPEDESPDDESSIDNAFANPTQPS
jgi:cyanoexosortase B